MTEILESKLLKSEIWIRRLEEKVELLENENKLLKKKVETESASQSLGGLLNIFSPAARPSPRFGDETLADVRAERDALREQLAALLPELDWLNKVHMQQLEDQRNLVMALEEQRRLNKQFEQARSPGQPSPLFSPSTPIAELRTEVISRNVRYLNEKKTACCSATRAAAAGRRVAS